MNECLNDKALVAFHTGDGCEADRHHLESCLSCVRRYRQLAQDLETIVCALKRPALAASVARRRGHSRWRWGLAAAAVLAAFAVGRFTSLAPASADRSSEVASVMPSAGNTPILEASAGSGFTTASYALYMEDLLTPDDPGPDLSLSSDSDGSY